MIAEVNEHAAKYQYGQLREPVAALGHKARINNRGIRQILFPVKVVMQVAHSGPTTYFRQKITLEQLWLEASLMWSIGANLTAIGFKFLGEKDREDVQRKRMSSPGSPERAGIGWSDISMLEDVKNVSGGELVELQLQRYRNSGPAATLAYRANVFRLNESSVEPRQVFSHRFRAA